jgi:hypothetical protein
MRYLPKGKRAVLFGHGREGMDQEGEMLESSKLTESCLVDIP